VNADHEPRAPGDAGPPDAARRAEALRVLSLLRDGRPVDAQAAAQARALAARDPGLAAELAAWERCAAVLAAEPGRRASPGFAARVLQAAGRERAAPAEVLVLPLLQRLAAAAALLLAVSLGWSLARPAPLLADPDVQRLRHAADHFRPTPFAPDDVEAGLRARLRDPAFLRRAPAEAPR